MRKAKSGRRELDLREKKVRFLSMAAHELRTPLVSIKGYTDLILNNHSDEVSERVETLLRVVERNTERLIELTEDLLTLKQIEDDELDICKEPIQTRGVLKDVFTEVKPLLEGRGQSLELGIPESLPSIEADRRLLEKALLGLVKSVSALTAGEETIYLEAVRAGEDIIIKVYGRGIGLEEDEMETAFDPFPDIDDLYPRGGSGISFCLCKGIVGLHGAENGVEKESETVSFTIRLPIKQ